MNERRTRLADSLEAELMAQSPEPAWRFVVREAVCDCDSCQGELVIVRLYGHSFPQDDPQDDPHAPLCKTWYADEVRRRKSMREFAGALIRQLSGNQDACA